MNNKPEIAIIESNTLTCLGLKSILEEIIPMATIRTFHSFNELMDDTPDMYAHYFISAQIYVEHNAVRQVSGNGTLRKRHNLNDIKDARYRRIAVRWLACIFYFFLPVISS